MLARHTAAIVLDDVAAVGDAQERIVGLVVVGARKVGLVGGDDRQLQRIGELKELRLDIVFALDAVALNFNVEAVVEHRCEPFEARLRQRPLALTKRAVNGTIGAAGERDQALGVRCQRVDCGVNRVRPHRDARG